MICTEIGCKKQVHAKERCHTHYMAVRRAAGMDRNPANGRSRVNGTGGVGISETIYRDRAAFSPASTPACRYVEGDQLTHLFYTSGNAPSTEGMAYCLRCPARLECLEYALDGNEHGLWGGVPHYKRMKWKREGLSPGEMIARQDKPRKHKTPAQSED